MKKIDFQHLPKAVVEIGKLNFQGTVIDDGWFSLTYKNGKPHMNAILILSEIVYWYRPKEIKNESTGALIGFSKRFRDDMLQKSYENLGDRFGISKRQAKAACDFLREKGIIRTEFRDFITPAGVRLNNVMYLEPVQEVLRQYTSITQEKYFSIPINQELEPQSVNMENQADALPPTSESGRVLRSNVPSPTLECKRVVHPNVPPPTLGCKTNTETTTEITTENITQQQDIDNITKKDNEDGPRLISKDVVGQSKRKKGQKTADKDVLESEDIFYIQELSEKHLTLSANKEVNNSETLLLFLKDSDGDISRIEDAIKKAAEMPADEVESWVAIIRHAIKNRMKPRQRNNRSSQDPVKEKILASKYKDIYMA